MYHISYDGTRNTRIVKYGIERFLRPVGLFYKIYCDGAEITVRDTCSTGFHKAPRSSSKDLVYVRSTSMTAHKSMIVLVSLSDRSATDTLTMLRPNGTRDIFAESAWKPSLDRYICGDTRDKRTTQDENMISQVRTALDERDEILIIYVSITQAVMRNRLPVADQRYLGPEYHSLRAH